jgi:hypothetical protein
MIEAGAAPPGSKIDAVRSATVKRTIRRHLGRAALVAAAAATVLVGATVLTPGHDRSVQAIGDAEPLGAGGEFHSLTPVRILDTRKPEPLDVAPLGRKATDNLAVDTVFNVPLAGKGGLPPFVDADLDGFDDNVLAVVVNIIVIDPTQQGYLRAFPAGAPEGTTSVVNFQAGSRVPNTAVVRPGVNGDLAIRLVSPKAPGSADVAIDISGWFSTSVYPDRGARLVPISPIRAYDSELAQFGATTRRALSLTKVPIRGAADVTTPGTVAVPDDANVVGVVVNVTGVNKYPGSKQTYISALPEPLATGEKPGTSTVNLPVGQTRANLAILPVGDDGAIHLFNLAGEIRLVVDVAGYLIADRPVDTRAGRVVPLVAPFRAFDTRLGEFLDQPLGPGRAEDWSFQSFVDDVNIDGVPVGAQSGMLANLTATGLQRQYAWAPVTSFITAYPSPASGDGTPPKVSNLNVAEADTVPNLALLRYGGDTEDPYQLRFYNRAGYVDYLLDVYAVVLSD